MATFPAQLPAGQPATPRRAPGFCRISALSARPLPPKKRERAAPDDLADGQATAAGPVARPGSPAARHRWGCGCRLGPEDGREAEGRVGQPHGRTPCLHYSKHPIRSQRGGNNGQTPGEIGFRAPLFWVQVLVRLLLASECPARANAELADNFRAFCRRQKTAARRRTPGADSGRGEASPAKTPRDTPTGANS